MHRATWAMGKIRIKDKLISNLYPQTKVVTHAPPTITRRESIVSVPLEMLMPRANVFGNAVVAMCFFCLTLYLLLKLWGRTLFVEDVEADHFVDVDGSEGIVLTGANEPFLSGIGKGGLHV